MITQVMVLPAFGWAEFGLMRNPWLAMVTVVPHLAWALSIGWLMSRDDERVTPVLPLRLGMPRIDLGRLSTPTASSARYASAVSYDLYFWLAGSTDEPGPLA